MIRYLATLCLLLTLAFTSTEALSATPRQHHKPVAEAPVTRPTIPEGPLGTSELIGFARFHQQFKPKDSFDARPSEADLDGKAFEVTAPVPDIKLNTRFAIAYWNYHADQQSLELVAMPESWRISAFTDDISTDTFMSSGTDVHGVYLTFTERNGAGYTGANAFGATTDVDVLHQAGVALIAPPGKHSFLDNAILSTKVDAIPPDRARHAVANAHVVIRGVLRAYEPGKVVMCGTEYHSATLDAPTERDTKVCAITSEIADIRVLSSDGDVLASWDNTSVSH